MVFFNALPPPPPPPHLLLNLFAFESTWTFYLSVVALLLSTPGPVRQSRASSGFSGGGGHLRLSSLCGVLQLGGGGGGSL